MQWTQEQINTIYMEVQKKAVMDHAFRTELLENPKAAVAKVAGEELPDGFKIKVIENDPAYNATFVLPDLLSDEISDEELDQVAGGVSIALVISACAAAVTIGPCPADACAAAAGK